MTQERFLLNEFFKTEEFVKALDMCDQRVFPLLYGFKLENEACQAALTQEVADDFVNEKNNIDLYVHAE